MSQLSPIEDPVGDGFVQLETSACLVHKVDETTCYGDVFTQGLPGFNEPS